MRHVTITHHDDCKRFEVPEVSDWKKIAEYVKSIVKPGDVVALSGPLGAGKTTFVQMLADISGVKKIPPSPTFALMRSYPVAGRGSVKRLLHVDAYRIEHPREMLALDLDEELSDGKTVLLIEWPENIKPWIDQHDPIRVEISLG